MKKIQYKDFSLKLHQRKWNQNKPNVCQFELTFACPLHCRHCHTDCYNNPKDLKNELTTKDVIFLLDKVYDSGVFWLCLTGGDPMARVDFLEIYTYARRKGFLVTIFTSAILITEEIADYFKKITPFCVELTLNGVTKKTYESVSGIKDSFRKAMSAIHRLKERNIPFKIKTQVMNLNVHEIDRIKYFTEGLGLTFRPSSLVFARLNRDITPCSLRISPERALEIQRKFNTNSMDKEEMIEFIHCRPQDSRNLFRCAAGADTFHIDPYGNMFLCSTVREPSVNLLQNEIADGFKLFKNIKSQEFKTDSKCKDCSIWHLCLRCPGRAYLETGNIEAPVEYFCELAHLIERNKNDGFSTAKH